MSQERILTHYKDKGSKSNQKNNLVFTKYKMPWKQNIKADGSSSSSSSNPKYVHIYF